MDQKSFEGYPLCLDLRAVIVLDLVPRASAHQADEAGPLVLGFWVWGLRVWGLGLTIRLLPQRNLPDVVGINMNVLQKRFLSAHSAY